MRLATIYMDLSDYEKAGKAFEKILSKFPSSQFTFDALYGLGYCQYRFGRLGDAASALRSVVSGSKATIKLQVKARLLLDQIEAAGETSGTKHAYGEYSIGALLPLGGEYSEFGERALRGVLLAAGVFGDREKSVQVQVMDLGAEDADSRRAVTKLATNKHVKGIVGPLLSVNALRAAKRAEQRHIPVIALSQKKGVPESGKYVFRNFLTLAQQARTVAAYSVEVLELKRFAVLYPKNSYGRELARVFAEEVVSAGGEVVGEKSYTSAQADFASELTELFELTTEERMEGRRRIREYKMGVEVDALFIPDNYEIIGQIAPYLAYFNIKDIQLLGANGWNSGKLMKLAGEYVEGAVFVDGFFAGSERPWTVDFVDRFRAAYGYEPGLLEAESFDSTMLLLGAITERGISRKELRNSLLEKSGYEGATGDIFFDSYGEAQKELFILTVERGRIKEIDNPLVMRKDSIWGSGDTDGGFDDESEKKTETSWDDDW